MPWELIKLIRIALSRYRQYAEMSVTSYGSDYIYPAIVPRYILQNHFWIIEEGGHFIREMIIYKVSHETEIWRCIGQQRNISPFRVLRSHKTSSNKASLSASSNKDNIQYAFVKLTRSKMRAFEMFVGSGFIMNYLPRGSVKTSEDQSEEIGKYVLYFERATLAVIRIFAALNNAFLLVRDS